MGACRVAHAPFYRMPFILLPLSCARCNFLVAVVDLIIAVSDAPAFSYVKFLSVWNVPTTRGLGVYDA